MFPAGERVWSRAARCGTVLVVRWHTGLLLLTMTHRATTTHSLKTPNVSCSVWPTECTVPIVSGWGSITKTYCACASIAFLATNHALVCEQYTAPYLKRQDFQNIRMQELKIRNSITVIRLLETRL